MTASTTTLSYPLQWPEAWERTPPGRRQRAKFGHRTEFQAAREVRAELERMDARHIVVSSNLMVRADGLPYSKQRMPEDPGVAVYFTLAGREQCIPCDKWDLVHHNLRAVALTIEALRGLERWGSKQILQAAFSGFKALPAPEDAKPVTPWWAVLKVDRTQADLELCELHYRHLAKRAHPDAGGSEAEMTEINRAMTEARQFYAGR